MDGLHEIGEPRLPFEEEEPAVPVNTWQEWQKEYRFGVVLIHPPEPVLSLVNALREKHDPRSHASCAAHISLTVPLPRALGEASLRELEEVAAGPPPQRIRDGPPLVFPSHPGGTLQVEPQEEIRRLVAALEAAPAFRGAAARRWPFTAHMTIAEFVDWEESAGILMALQGERLVGTFTCAHLSVAVPDARFRFTERHRLILGGAAEGARIL